MALIEATLFNFIIVKSFFFRFNVFFFVRTGLYDHRMSGRSYFVSYLFLSSDETIFYLALFLISLSIIGSNMD